MKQTIFLILCLTVNALNACVTVNRENETYTVDSYGAPAKTKLCFTPDLDPSGRPVVDDKYNWQKAADIFKLRF